MKTKTACKKCHAVNRAVCKIKCGPYLILIIVSDYLFANYLERPVAGITRENSIAQKSKGFKH